MKTLTLFLLSLTVGWSSAYLIKVPTLPTKTRIAPVGWVHIQKLMLPLFENVCEDSTNPVIVQLAKNFTLDASNGDYTKNGVVDYIQNIKTTKGFLPKGEIFTEYNKDHTSELKALYDLFYYAKDFDTFYRTAAWARQNINCGLFIDAIYLAIVNRRDMEKISVPAPYELMPNYFINRDVVVKASFLLTSDEVVPDEDVKIEGNSYILDAKYTTEPEDGDDDEKLAYFREDIGLNAYYFIRKLQYTPWFNTETDVNSYYGERVFQMMKQFAARYDLERYANELPELEGFTYYSAVNAYDPMLIYSNGNEFDHRSYSGVLNDNDDITFLKTIENNLASVVTHLRQAGHSKFQILNHLIELLVASDKSYESVLRKLIRYDTNGSERQLSVFDHYMTTMRDPVFWRINKKLVQLIDNSLKMLPTYTRNELYFPGVEVRNVETKKMMTSFDSFQFDVTDSLKAATANATFQVKIAQPRLNHKPFTIKLNISSLVTKKSFVKIYLGPKTMPGELAQKKHLFVLLDMFELSLKRGANVVSRSSDQMSSFSDDFMSLRTLKKKVEDAEFGLDALPLKTIESQIGYPSRLNLPKGLAGGLPLQLFVFVAPFTKSTIGGSASMANMELNTAILSPGYPLDLNLETRQLFGLPNAFVKDIVITHKAESKSSGGYGGRPNSNMGGRPYDNSQSDLTANKDDFNEVSQDDNMEEYINDDSLLVHGLLGDRPDFTYKKTNNNNFSAKKNQYRKTNDFAAKRMEYRKTDYSNKATDKQSDSLLEVEDMNNVEYMKSSERPNYKISINDDVNNFRRVTTNDHILPTHGLLGERPSFTYKNKDTTSFTANKDQYSNKNDYTTKRVEYKKEDTQDWYGKRKNDEILEFSDQNSHQVQYPEKSFDKSFKNSKNNDVNSDVFHYENNDQNNNKPPVHGLLGKSTEDHTVKKNKYEIKKDNFVQKAETKRVEFRQKAFDKKAKIGVLDYSLLEKPKDLRYNSKIDTSVEYKRRPEPMTTNKEVSGNKLYKEITDDKALKEIKTKSKLNKTDSYLAKNDDSIDNFGFLNKKHSSEAFEAFDETSKINYKQTNKNITGTVMPHAAKDKYFSKVIKGDSEEIDFYDKDGFSKIINKNIVQNKDATTQTDMNRDINETTEKNEWYNENSFTKTINKDVTKNRNPSTHNSIETYFDDSFPASTAERTRKRVSVYDYIFNPQNYSDEELKVYE